MRKELSMFFFRPTSLFTITTKLITVVDVKFYLSTLWQIVYITAMTRPAAFIVFLAIACCYSCSNDNVKPAFNCEKSDLALEIAIRNADCNLINGQLKINATGGQAPYSYQINNGLSQETAKFDNLGSGEYRVMVTDNYGCTVTGVVIIESNNNLTVSALTTIADCGLSNGTIKVQVLDGQAPYLYRLDDGAPQPSEDFNVGPGIYAITVIDAIGCEFIVIAQVISATSYIDNVQPIIVNSCAIIGCHDGSNSRLSNYNNFEEVQAHASMIKSRTQTGNMPKTGRLSQEQIDLIACWVDDGALAN